MWIAFQESFDQKHDTRHQGFERNIIKIIIFP
jgi:hypothetical protein